MPAENENYDEQHNIKWYRKVQNPDVRMADLAVVFAAWITVPLGINPPEIHWFEKVEKNAALTGWGECPSADRQSFACVIDENPLRFNCQYFFLRGYENEVHVGCTPVNSEAKVLIQTGLSYYCTFRAIADECYHVYQDASRGPDWRNEADPQFVEHEAASFADSLAVPIRLFLEKNGVFHK